MTYSAAPFEFSPRDSGRSPRHRTCVAAKLYARPTRKRPAPPRLSRRQVEAILAQAVGDLQADRPNLFAFTDATKQSEWNLARHLSVKIHKYLAGLDCDVDVIKPDYGDQRPDIIFHRTETHRSNVLVIEMKKDGTARDVADDLEKIKTSWFKPPLRYRFGAAINIRSDRRKQIVVLENPTRPPPAAAGRRTAHHLR